MNIVECLAAKEPGNGGDQSKAKRKVNIGLGFAQWKETRLKINVLFCVSLRLVIKD